jgi:putative YhbY family RNA-binding protein
MPFLKGFLMLQLSSDQRRELRARAHNINPVVSISENGLTEAVLREIELNLKAHELIKIRVYGDSRENRISYLEQICEKLEAGAVQHIGKLLIVYRPDPNASATVNAQKGTNSRRSPSEPRKTKRSFQG